MARIANYLDSSSYYPSQAIFIWNQGEWRRDKLVTAEMEPVNGNGTIPSTHSGFPNDPAKRGSNDTRFISLKRALVEG